MLPTKKVAVRPLDVPVGTDCSRFASHKYTPGLDPPEGKWHTGEGHMLMCVLCGIAEMSKNIAM